jgi:hypothetical protein
MEGVTPDQLELIITGKANYYDSGRSQPGNLQQLEKSRNFKLEPADFQLQTSSPTNYLQYPRDNMLATAAPNKSFVGALPPAP